MQLFNGGIHLHYLIRDQINAQRDQARKVCRYVIGKTVPNLLTVSSQLMIILPFWIVIQMREQDSMKSLRKHVE